MKSSNMRSAYAEGLAFALVVALCLAAFPGQAWGQEPPEVEVSGELQEALAVSLDDGGLVANTASYRLSLEQELGRTGPSTLGKLYISLRGNYDLAAGSGRLAELDEAYLDLYLRSADLRIGQQIVSWGTAYGVNPTSYVNPLPNLAPTDLAKVMELAGLPVPAIGATAYPSWGDAALVVVLNPRLQGVPLPETTQAALLEGVALQVSYQYGLHAELACDRFLAVAPESVLERLEFAGKAGTRFGNWDLYLSGFRGWEDQPVLWVATELKPGPGGVPFIEVSPEATYRRATSVGVAASCTWRAYTLWGEGSCTWPDNVPELDNTRNIAFSSNKPYMQVVLGGDRSLGGPSEFYLMAEYLYSSNRLLLTPYWLLPGEPRAGHYIIGTARCSPAVDHQLELAGIYSLTDGSSVALSRYTYELTPGVSLWFGLTLPRGDSGTEFGNLSSSRIASIGVRSAF